MDKVKIYKLCLLLPFILVLISGCWSKKELDELAIVTGIGIDQSEEGYLITVQVINPAEVAAKQMTTRTSVSSYSASGESVFEAIRNLIEVTPREVYLSHTRVVIFSEDIAREGIRESLDFLIRDHELRTDFFITVAKDLKAEELLNVLTPLEKIPSSKMYGSIETSYKYLSQTRTVKIQQLISDLLLKGKQPFLTGITKTGPESVGNNLENVQKIDSTTQVQMAHIGVLKDDKLIGWLNANQSKGYNYITGNVQNTIQVTNCGKEDNKISFEIIKTDTKMKGKVQQGTPSFTVDINVQANIADVQCKVKLSKPEQIKRLETKINEEIKKTVMNTVNILQNDLQSDIIGFGEYLRRTHNKEWNKYKGNWDETFSDVDVQVKVKSKIKRTGTIMDSFQQGAKE